MIRALCLLGALLSAPVAALSQDAPARVVSINLCTDQMAMLLARPGQLVSVSHLALDPRSSAMVAQAADYPVNHSRAEEIYLMKPDLVLAGRYSSRATVQMLQRLGIEVATFDLAYSLEDVSARLLQMGAVLGQQTRAQAMVAAYEARLDGFRHEVTSRPRAAIYHANGYTSGEESLAGQILVAAGLDNIAAEAGLRGGGTLPLEMLAMAQPDAVVTSDPFPAASRAEEIMSHPVIDALRRTRSSAAITDHDWVCGTPFVLGAIERMTDLRHTVERTQR